MFEIIYFIGYIGLATTIIVPLGVLLHYARQADRHPPVARGLSAEAAAFWQRGARRVVRRGKLASGCALALAVPFVYMHNAVGAQPSEWVTYVGPLIAMTLIIVLFLCRPATRRASETGSSRQIDLNQRTVWSFGRRWWYIGAATAAALLVLSLVAAGLLSSPDENGDYVRLTIELGGGSASTFFLGWYYGVPIILAVAALALTALVTLWLTARVPLATTSNERTIDIWLRGITARSVLSLSCGALILTLGYVSFSIGSAAQMGYGIGAPGEHLAVGAPFAALSEPLRVAGHLLKGLGYALILLPLLTKSPRLSFAAPADTIPADDHIPGVGARPETAGSTANVELPVRRS